MIVGRIVNAILYVVRSGCQGRMLPKDFPPWKTVYQIFCRWRLNGLWDKVHDALRTKVRQQDDRKSQPTAAIIDSQSVKMTEVGGPRGYHAEKQVNGRKRHIIVDTMGLLLAIIVHSAEQQDQSGACLVLHALREKMKRIRVIFADSAYGRLGLPTFVRATLGFALETVRRTGLTFGWIGRSRRHSKEYERIAETSQALIQISMIHLMLRRLA